MNRQFNIVVFIVSFICLLATSGTVYAAACTSNVATGNWSVAGTWTNCGGTFPGAADTATILNGHSVTTNANTSTTTLTINSGGTLNAAAFNLTISGSTGIAGTLNITSATGTKTFTGDVTVNSGGTWNNSANEIISFGGSLQNDGTFTAGTGVYTFSGAGKTLSGANTIAIPSVTVSGTYQNNGTLTVSTTLAGTGTLTNGASGTLNIGAATVTPTMTASAVGNTVNYTGAAQNIKSTSYHNLGLSGSNTKTAAGSFLIAGDLTINGVTLVSAATVQTVNGNINNTGTHTATTGSITLSGGSSAHFLSGNGIYANLVLNDTLGATLTGSPTVSGILTLTNGDISTGSNIMEVSATCATGISGGSSTSYVAGNLRLHYPAGTTTCTFPIGDTANYTPATVAMIGVTSTLINSTVTARTDTPDHTDTTTGASGIDGAKSVNRTWTLTPGGSLVFGTHSITFNFVAGDIDGGATSGNFIIARKNIGTWTYPTMGAVNATNTSATGMTAFGEFAIGEPAKISGTVFEDINYGGGAGRNMTTSSGAAIAGVRVELYNNAGTFLSFTTTIADGTYTFKQVASGTYTVRVVNSSIPSTRGCAAGTCLPVQTFRTNASTGSAVAVTDHVGGENPAVVDVGNSTLSGAQSITTVVKTAVNVTSVDFGFNFDTIVNINDSGQGSLRQFIINANTLTGADTSIFMIPNGAANPGQNTGYANKLTTSGANIGAAVITLASSLPDITGANTTLDGTTQTTNVGDTNPGTVGTGGTVGTMAQPLPRFNRPEVVIALPNTQLTASGVSVVIKGLAIANGGITVNGSSSQVIDCLSGMNADGTYNGSVSPPGYGITAGSGTGILISHNYVKINNSAIRGDSPGANLTIQYNEVDAPNNTNTPGGGHSTTFDGILIVGNASNVTIQYNLSKNQRGGGLEYGFAGGTVVTGMALGNTILNNGFSGGSRSTEPVGVAIWQLSATSALTIKQNVITGNAGPGIVVISATGVSISENSIYANGNLITDIGIDLNSLSGDPNTYTAQGVTLNDLNDADSGPNGLLNFPVIESAIISGGNLVLKGWTRPGSVIEFFIAAPDTSGFGSGKTYLTTLAEGSGADTDSISSTYGPGAINGILQGTDTTNRFSFTIPLPGGVTSGTVLTATATLGGNTSEFSGNVIVSGLPAIAVIKSANVTSVAPGQDIIYTVTVTNTGQGSANTVVITDKLSPFVSFCMNPFAPSTVPFDFAPGTSGLTLDTSLIKYSNDYGATWSYVPSGSYDGAVTNWQISFPAGSTMSSGNTNFVLRYRVQVK